VGAEADVHANATIESLAWTNMGVIAEKSVFFEQAYDCYAQALSLFPENSLACKYLDQLRDLADPDDGPIGVRRLSDGTHQTYVWDGAYFASRE
jgi:hypothetical protein